MRSPHHTSCVALVVLASFLLLGTQICCAQTDDAAGAEVDPAAPVRVVETESGTRLEPIEIIPVLPPDVPASFISSLKVRGEALASRANLTIDVRVSVTRADVWEEVPLRLSEARVLSVRYQGDGQHGPVVAADRGDGLSWKFRGQGEHQLTLDVEVPIKRSQLGASLSLSMPRLNKWLSGEVELLLPGNSLEVEALGLDFTATPTTNDVTRVSARLRGGTDAALRSVLELRWTSASTAAPGSIASVSSDIEFNLDPARQLERLVVNQEIVPLDSDLASIRMRLPSVFELASVEGQAYEQHSVVDSPEGGRVVVVTLSEVVGNEIRLRWTFERPIGDRDDQAIVDGFDVANAEKQTGRFACLASPGYRSSILWDQSSGLRRVSTSNASELTAASLQFFPFRARIRVRKERPSITVAPVTNIVATESTTFLRSTFQIEIDRGLVDELTGEWADPSGTNWDNLQVVSPPDAELIPDQGGFVIRLLSPRDKAFSITLTGNSAGARSGSDVMIPRLLAENEAPTNLRLYASDAVDLDVTSDSETRLVPVVAPGVREPPPEAAGCRFVQQVRVIGEPAVVVLEAEVREAVATARSAVDVRVVASPDNEGLLAEFSQEIDLSVQFGRVTEIDLISPIAASSAEAAAAIASEYRFRINGKPVFADQVTVNGTGGIRIELMDRLNATEGLKQCLLGIDTNALPITRGEETVTVPFLRLAETPFDSLTCRVNRNQVAALQPVSSEALDWLESSIAAADVKAWVATDPPPNVDQIEFDVSTSVDASAAALGVRNFSTVVDLASNGLVVSTEIDFLETNGAIVIAVPQDALSTGFTWNGQPVDAVVPAALLVERVADYETFVIPVPNQSSGKLGITYRQVEVASGWLYRVSVDFPLLPAEHVWREQDLTVALQVPPDGFLFRAPRNLAPRYRWERRGLFWQRVSSAPESGALARSNANSRRYSFSSPAIVSSAEFQLVQGTAFVFFTGMCSLIIAFLLYRTPQARTVPKLLGMALALVLFGLLDPELLRLLLQPVTLGALFAIVAVAIDSWRERRAGGTPVLRVVSENDYSNWSDSAAPQTPDAGAASTYSRPFSQPSSRS